jgi:hypothetical protein
VVKRWVLLLPMAGLLSACAAAPGHAPAPERCAETARDGSTAALRRAGQAA